MKKLLLAKLAVFWGAMLLFVVQPMVARMVLPILGGTAQVWNTCILFFQGALLLGYCYAHISLKYLGVKKQAWLHSFLLPLPLLTLPFAFGSEFAPTEKTPLFWLLGMLMFTVGPSYVVIAATAPMIQRWYSQMGQEDSDDPYFLYAASNGGSLLALLAYPLVIEPFLGTQFQTKLWTYGYCLLVMLLWLNNIVLQKSVEAKEDTTAEIDLESLSKFNILRWLLLAAIPVSLMLGVTTHITSELAPIPLLWIIPLLLYLLSYIVAFARKPIVSLRLALIVQALSIAALAIIMFTATRTYAFFLHWFSLLVSAYVCHLLLAKERPHKSQLTAFYLIMATGGVLGGLVNAVIAPMLFPFVAEYSLALVVVCLLRPKLEEVDEKAARRKDWQLPLVLGLLSVGTLCLLPRVGGEVDVMARVAILFFVAAVAHYFRQRPFRFAMAIAVVLVGGFISFRTESLFVARSYYGAYRVTEEAHNGNRVLYNGVTIQGMQASSLSSDCLYCYHLKGPIGQMLLSKKFKSITNIGALGLGVGALANYGRSGQKITFYEIDELVEKIARNDKLFTYLKNSRADVGVVIGDGRSMLSRESDDELELLVLDAFSSNAIPVHLLTKEAFELYFKKLSQHAVCAVHVSNRHLDIAPLLAALAESSALVAYLGKDISLSPEEERRGAAPSTWVILARKEAHLVPWMVKGINWSKLTVKKEIPVWTDDYVHYLSLLRW